MDLQQRWKLREGDADDVSDLFEVNFIVKQLRALDADFRLLLDDLRLDEEKLGKNDADFSGRVCSLEAENDAVGETVELC